MGAGLRGPFQALFWLRFEGWAGVVVGVLVSGWELVHASIEEWAQAWVQESVQVSVRVSAWGLVLASCLASVHVLARKLSADSVKSAKVCCVTRLYWCV